MKQRSTATQNIPLMRLHNQRIMKTQASTPAGVVAHLGAMQAQDYAGVQWSIALRLPSCTVAEVEAAVAARTIVRTWPQRGTLHFVAAEDVRWMLELLAPRTIAGSTLRRTRLELDDKTLQRCFKVLEKALAGGAVLSRPAVMQLLEQSRISTKDNRGYHILWQAALAGLICFGPLQGKQHSFVLFDEWVPPAARPKDRDEALVELAARYFLSRGPATLKDFIWWSGLTAGDARRGLEGAKSLLASEPIGDETYWFPPSAAADNDARVPAFLLPGFDEYLLGYTDRSAVLDAAYAQRVIPGNNGMFMPTVVIDGRVAGTWKRTARSKAAFIDLAPFDSISKTALRSLEDSAKRFSDFMKLPHTVRMPE